MSHQAAHFALRTDGKPDPSSSPSTIRRLFRSLFLGAMALLAILWLWWLWTDFETAKRSVPLVAVALARGVPWKLLARAVPWNRARARQREQAALLAAMNKDPIACLEAIAKNGGKVPPIAFLESLAKTGQVPG